MSDVVTWLRDQIYLRRTLAVVASKHPYPIWEPEGDHLMAGHGDGTAWEAGWVVGSDMSVEVLEHAALNDPRDVIARCDAELAILDEHAPFLMQYGTKPDGTPNMEAWCVCCNDSDDRYASDTRSPCKTVRLIAQGYRHRPGWKDTWSKQQQRKEERHG